MPTWGRKSKHEGPIKPKKDKEKEKPKGGR